MSASQKGPASLARRLGLGRLLLHCWHTPLCRLRDLVADGGPLERRRMLRGKIAMAGAACALEPLRPASPLPPLKPYLLTGYKYWYQTAFCLQSLCAASGRRVEPVIIDDGSLTPEQAAHLARLFPGTRLVGQRELAGRLEQHLPVSRFPRLRERREAYPHIRKLIDVHLGAPGWKLVMDSDLLFFREPAELLSWMDAPLRPLHGTDCMDSYGYSRPLMERLAGHAIPGRLNVGLCGLDGSEIDWDKLESWTGALLDAEGTSYYLEQALCAMLMAGRDCVRLPWDDYQTPPGRSECLAPRAAMHHYVASSKRWYFTRCWRAFSPARKD